MLDELEAIEQALKDLNAIKNDFVLDKINNIKKAAIKIISNTFAMEWPPHSGKQQEFPEVDRSGWRIAFVSSTV